MRSTTYRSAAFGSERLLDVVQRSAGRVLILAMLPPQESAGIFSNANIPQLLSRVLQAFPMGDVERVRQMIDDVDADVFVRPRRRSAAFPAAMIFSSSSFPLAERHFAVACQGVVVKPHEPILEPNLLLLLLRLFSRYVSKTVSPCRMVLAPSSSDT